MKGNESSMYKRFGKNAILRNMMIALSVFMVVILVSGCSKSGPGTTGDIGNQVNIGNPSVNADNATANIPNGSQGNSSGQSAGDGTPSNPKIIHIEAYNFGFRMNGPQINKGDTVRIIATSTDGTHGVMIPAFNVDISPIDDGEQKTAQFVADKAGSFDYFCNVPCGPGHRSMKGTIVVN